MTHIASGDDNLDGGAGNDTMFASDARDPFDNDTTQNATAAPTGDLVDGGTGSDTLYGHAGNDTLIGDDESAGDVGNDLLFGGRGADYLLGGDGIDLLVGGLDADILDAGDGLDDLRLEANGAGTALVDLIINGGSPEADDFKVKGALVTSQAAIDNQLSNDVGVSSDFDTGMDDLIFTSFSDFSA